MPDELKFFLIEGMLNIKMQNTTEILMVVRIWDIFGSFPGLPLFIFKMPFAGHLATSPLGDLSCCSLLVKGPLSFALVENKGKIHVFYLLLTPIAAISQAGWVQTPHSVVMDVLGVTGKQRLTKPMQTT